MKTNNLKMQLTALLFFVLASGGVLGQLCGNGILDLGEDCELDGQGLEISSCQSLGFLNGGLLKCNSNCTYDVSSCAVCGDGRIDGLEECDGYNLASLSCAGYGFALGGILQCDPNCRVDTSACAVCGDGIVEGLEECDGLTLSGKSCALMGKGDGVLLCDPLCKFNYSLCSMPKILRPDGSLSIRLPLGITVEASGYVSDRKVTVTFTDGINWKTFRGVLVQANGMVNSLFLSLTPLIPSVNWRVLITGEQSGMTVSSNQFIALSF